MSVMSRSKFNKKVLLKLLASPITILPFLAGVTDLLALWALEIDSGIATFAGLACILGSVGIFASRFLLGGKTLDREVLESLEQEAHAKREKALDVLDRKLTADGDPRTERCLRDLRTLTKRFREGRSWAGTLSSRATFDILTGVDRLLDRSVYSLEETLKLWHTARDISLPDARKPILEKREAIIEEVGKSIEHLGRVLAGVQSLGGETEADTSELARIRNELDASLAVARRVEDRMQALDRELHTDVHDHRPPLDS